MRVIKDEGNELEIEIDDANFVNPLVAELLRDHDVEYAGNIKDHPFQNTTRLILRTKKGDARKALDRAIAGLRADLEDIREKLD